ncbi:hypothetical protein GCM10010441_44030 [Kitasatospora paracochleata]|uniref:SseB protein N-terminal domain-containing protein n=1 Tax=Kitasatospora paracochleata TaxID=58354 RepID=A0ABT1IXG2_9ACTN|nr:SAV_915 family protein [Kitasatospora paracochleata]MCP2309206.1 hypothetical protein [Kitasatospora paracochleata]
MITEGGAADDPHEHGLRHVPVRTVGTAQVLRLFRHRDGSRCAVAFSTAKALHALLGADQESAELTEPALRELTEPLGVHHLVLDPALVAPPAGTRGRVPTASDAERRLEHQR